MNHLVTRFRRLPIEVINTTLPYINHEFFMRVCNGHNLLQSITMPEIIDDYSFKMMSVYRIVLENTSCLIDDSRYNFPSIILVNIDGSHSTFKISDDDLHLLYQRTKWINTPRQVICWLKEGF